LLCQQRPATVRWGDSQEKAGAADLVSRAALAPELRSGYRLTPAASAKSSEAGPLSGFFP
jgi:hypothetical protein